MYPQAAFCYEEVLLHAPQNIALYVQYADILYTMGGPTGANYRTARSYYAAAVQLSKGSNIRALFGLCACAAQLSGMKVRLSLAKSCCRLHSHRFAGIATRRTTCCL